MEWAAYRMAPEVQLFWSRLEASSHAAREAAAFKSSSNILWDRGASWFAADNEKSRRMLAHMGYAIANSYASRRMLELRWGFDRPIAVCRNALRPSVRPHKPSARSLPTDRGYILGIAARLIPLKGVESAIRAVAVARQRGLEVELHIAGEGMQRDYLNRLAENLHIQANISFLGLVQDMPAFYRSIDCLIHLALREPFGQILVEAMAYGCPVIATRVDGMVEVVRDGVDGYLVPPTLDMEQFILTGASVKDMPPFVFDPATDTIGPPRAVDPEHAADYIADVFGDAGRYRRMSASASERAIKDFRFEDHVSAVMTCLSQFSARQP
jgi:glycosyltransferase involved in cell wall biosynthesis